jgi:Flp pilus assembly pilin Flp
MFCADLRDEPKSAPIHSINSLTSHSRPGMMVSNRTHPPEVGMAGFMYRLFIDEEGQDIAEYAVMLAVILVLVVGTIRLIGTNSNTAFSSVASSIQ